MDTFVKRFFLKSQFLKFFWADIAQRGIPSVVIVKHFNVINDVPSCFLSGPTIWKKTLSVFKLPKKISATALSQQLPFRLMLLIITWIFSIFWKLLLQYWLPLSECNTMIAPTGIILGPMMMLWKCWHVTMEVGKSSSSISAPGGRFNTTAVAEGAAVVLFQ